MEIVSQFLSIFFEISLNFLQGINYKIEEKLTVTKLLTLILYY